jgi:SAM-dependent methyltransferase
VGRPSNADPSAQNRQQKAFFERDPRRLATALCRDDRFPRTVRKKMDFAADRFAGCGRLLEVGTGHGVELSRLLAGLGPEARYWGVDIALFPLLGARRRLAAAGGGEAAHLATALAEGLPFADASFDGVFCLDVLHHVRSQVEMLAEVHRVLRPGGRLLALEPNPLFPSNLVYLRDPIERQLFELTAENARRWTAEAGLAEPRLEPLPIFFPGFPRRFAPLYDRAERLLAHLPALRQLSTTRVLTAVRPEREAE